MGEIYRGIPPWAAAVAQRVGATVLIETGTHAGFTAVWAAERFKQVYTVEISPVWAARARKRLRPFQNVLVMNGDSLKWLPHFVTSAEDAPYMAWLDAHWSRDLGYARPETVCPLLDEIAILQGARAILIDDVRLLGKGGWPSMDEVVVALGDGWQVGVRDDVLTAVSLV